MSNDMNKLDIWINKLNTAIRQSLTTCPPSKTCINYANDNHVKILNPCLCNYCGIIQSARVESGCATEKILKAIINVFSQMSDSQKRLALTGWRVNMSDEEFAELVKNEIFSKCNSTQNALNNITNTQITIEKCGTPNHICETCGIYQYCDLKSQCIYYTALNIMQNRVFKNVSTNKYIIGIVIAIGITALMFGIGITYYVIQKRVRK